MTRTQAILAGLALAFWVAAYFWFFHRDLRRWLTRREQRARQRAEAAARQARLRDDLARRLPPGRQH
ncbi:MAG: hypothetical protein J0I21_18240 [Alphaproteobacteria bacterium]|nr:hypothetical protein [Alphaproteobacteria bacterium]